MQCNWRAYTKYWSRMLPYDGQSTGIQDSQIYIFNITPVTKQLV